MNQNTNTTLQWREEKVSVRVKLSILWIGAMFFIVYADIKAFFETEFIEQIVSGQIEGLVINQAFLFYSAVLMTIPPVMAFLSRILKPTVNRIVNIVMGSLHIGLLTFCSAQLKSGRITTGIQPWK